MFINRALLTIIVFRQCNINTYYMRLNRKKSVFFHVHLFEIFFFENYVELLFEFILNSHRLSSGN